MQSALEKIPGIKDLDVKKGSASLTVPNVLKDEKIISTIKAVGFDATIE